MIHLGLAIIYLIITVYYLITPLLSFEQRIHASCASFMMLYSLIRHRFVINDLPVFFLMQWCLYTIDGGKQQPIWFTGYITKLLVMHIIVLAETKIYTMYSEIHRVLPE